MTVNKIVYIVVPKPSIIVAIEKVSVLFSLYVCVSVNNNLFYKIFLSIYNRVNFIDIFNWLSRNPIDTLLERDTDGIIFLVLFI